MKKQIYLIISIVLFSGLILAQTPQSFKYQAVARNSNGTLIQNQLVAFRISILEGSPSGTLVYQERHTLTTSNYGSVNLDIGLGTVLQGTFSSIIWSAGQMFLKVELDPAGGTAYLDMGTTQLLSVPYALYSRSSENGVPVGSAGQTLRSDGTSWIPNSTIYNNGSRIGIGTLTPANVLDIAGANNYDLTISEGDMRIGNNSYRLKFGVATEGGGAGVSGIMQYGQPGGYNVFNLGSQGNNILQLNGSLNRAGIGTDSPQGKLEIRSGSTTEPQLLLSQTISSDWARLRMNNTYGARYWDIGALISTSTTTDRLNFYNNAGGSILTLTGDGKIGINNYSPNSPLTFAALLGKKITLFPGGSGDVGFGVSNNRLQIYSDNPNADVAIGYDAAGTFNEMFAFKPNGALALSGNTGSTGQVIHSNGYNGTYWDLPVKTYQWALPSLYDFGSTSETSILNQSYTTSTNSTLIISVQIGMEIPWCVACPDANGRSYVYIDGNKVGYLYLNVGANSSTSNSLPGFFAEVGPGTHTFQVTVMKVDGPNFNTNTLYSYANILVVAR